MPYALQAKVLRFIQFGTYRRVGDNEERTANCRVIAATCAPLQDLIASGRFRKDLYYRLSTFNLHLTPLRERHYDAVHYVGENLDKSIEDSDYDTFLDYASNATLEGNYRELEQAILRYDVLKELPAQFRR